ncbi:DUF3592 domain-containing protein [Sulfurovum sp.]|uniref:DUF3592 domain-containing protein n=1 Tax=Sulfurovum sp. TaxID=1969726 RepID=UPI00356A7214
MIEFNRSFWLAFSAFIGIAFFSVKLAFLYFGMYLLYKAIFLKYQYFRLRKWRRVEGSIIECKIEYQATDLWMLAPIYNLCIKYRYEIDGQTYYSTDYSIYEKDLWTTNKKELEMRVKKMKRKNHITVFVDPDNYKSVLFIEMFSNARTYFYFNLVLGLTVFIAGLMMVF